MEIAIVGGGICGLTCAIGLMKAGVDVQVYEAAPQFAEIGAGLGIGPNATRVLRKLELLEDIMIRGDKVHDEWFQYISGLNDHKVLHEFSLNPGEEPFMVHRAAFLDALVRHVDHSKVQFRKRCVKVSQLPSSSKLIIHFADGTTASADVVIGADGIKSAVRGAVTETDPSKSITFSHTSIYRGLAPIETIKAAGVKTDLTRRPVCILGPGKHMIIFGINAGKLVNMAVFGPNAKTPPEGWTRGAPADPAVVAADTDELLAVYKGWGSEVSKIIGCVPQWSKWRVNVVYPPLNSYVNHRVALIGDAAHGMLPHLGAGAGQGLEDAYLLSRLLSHPQATVANVETVLKVYDEVRRPRAQRVWDDTYRMGDICDGLGPSGLSSEGLNKDIDGIWDYIWGRGPDEDVFQAESQLQGLGAFVSSRL